MEPKKNWPVWATEKIEIVGANPEWKDIGESLKKEIVSLLTAFNVTDIEHIGSTSVPGLAAKPIIDIMAKINSFNDTDKIAALLQPLNWNYVPAELDENQWRRLFVKVKNNKRFAHLHLVLNNSDRWQQHLKFRELLSTDTLLKNEYALLKTNLAAAYPDDREAYTAAKSDFILQALGQ